MMDFGFWMLDYGLRTMDDDDDYRSGSESGLGLVFLGW